MYYVVDDLKNLTESLTKEQILAAIVQAVEQHAVADVDTGFVTMLKEQNYGNALKMWVGTTADYNALETKEDNCLYLLSDDATYDDLIASISRVKQIQNEALAKNGAVILNTAVAYGWNLAVDIDNTIPIDSFSIVKVRVRFAVDVQGNTVFICGAGSIGTSSVVFRIARVQLEINKTTKKLIENSTVIVPFVEDGSTDTLVKATIDKITGVM